MNLRRKQFNARNGIETVELAIVLPVLILITFGTLEVCEGIMLRQKVEIAAHEGARVAIRQKATIGQVEQAVADCLDARGIDYGDISTAVNATPPNSVNTLEPVSVAVTINVDNNIRMPSTFYSYWTGNSITAEVIMLKEFGQN